MRVLANILERLKIDKIYEGVFKLLRVALPP